MQRRIQKQAHELMSYRISFAKDNLPTLSFYDGEKEIRIHSAYMPQKESEKSVESHASMLMTAIIPSIIRQTYIVFLIFFMTLCSFIRTCSKLSVSSIVL